MTRKEAVANLNMISVAFVEPVTKEQRKLIDDTFDMAIEALEQLTSYERTINKLTEALNQQKEGHWITTRTFMHDGEYYCDKCKCESPNNEKWDYCPNCGADMREGE